MEELFTSKQVAAKLGILVENLYIWKMKNWIPIAKRIGRTDYYTQEQVNEISSNIHNGVFCYKKRLGYGIYKTAEKLGIDTGSLHYWRKMGFVQQGLKSGKRFYYTAEMIEQMRKDIKSGVLWQKGKDGYKYYNQSEAARYCSIHHTTFNSMVCDGRLPTPTHGVLRPKYREDELPALKELASKSEHKGKEKNWQNIIAAQGYYSITSAAKYLNMPYITFVSYLNRERVPRPNHKVGSSWWYTAAELEKIKHKQLAVYFLQTGR